MVIRNLLLILVTIVSSSCNFAGEDTKLPPPKIIGDDIELRNGLISSQDTASPLEVRFLTIKEASGVNILFLKNERCWALRNLSEVQMVEFSKKEYSECFTEPRMLSEISAIPRGSDAMIGFYGEKSKLYFSEIDSGEFYREFLNIEPISQTGPAIRISTDLMGAEICFAEPEMNSFNNKVHLNCKSQENSSTTYKKAMLKYDGLSELNRLLKKYFEKRIEVDEVQAASKQLGLTLTEKQIENLNPNGAKCDGEIIKIFNLDFELNKNSKSKFTLLSSISKCSGRNSEDLSKMRERSQAEGAKLLKQQK